MSEYVVAVATTFDAISVHPPVPVSDRSTTKWSWFTTFFVHDRSMEDDDAAVAVRFVTAAGVVTESTLLVSESSPAL